MSARPFTETEFTRLNAYFAKRGSTRNRLLLILGCGTGFRISEILSLRVHDVWSGTAVLPELTIARRNLKGGRGAHLRSVKGRRCPLAEPVREAITAHLNKIGTANLGRALFSTTQARGVKMNRSTVFRAFRVACEYCQISPARVSTHSFRKTFVGRIYSASGHCLISTQRIVGHANPQTTARYIETDAATLDALVRACAA